MVYIPYDVVKRWMMEKHRRLLDENPNVEPLYTFDVKIQWFKWLEWIPNSQEEFEKFRNQFPIQDRGTIHCRPYTAYERYKMPYNKRRGGIR